MRTRESLLCTGAGGPRPALRARACERAAPHARASDSRGPEAEAGRAAHGCPRARGTVGIKRASGALFPPYPPAAQADLVAMVRARESACPCGCAPRGGDR